MWGWILSIVAAVIAGLILINKNLINSRIKAIILHINDMEAHGHEYWSNDYTYPNNKKLEIEIKRLSHRIGVEIQQLNNDCIGYSFSKGKLKILTRFRQSITGGSFESANRQSDEAVIRNISIACNILIDQCRKSVKTFIIF